MLNMKCEAESQKIFYAVVNQLATRIGGIFSDKQLIFSFSKTRELWGFILNLFYDIPFKIYVNFVFEKLTTAVFILRIR